MVSSGLHNRMWSLGIMVSSGLPKRMWSLRFGEFRPTQLYVEPGHHDQSGPTQPHVEHVHYGIVFANGGMWKEQRSLSIAILKSFGMGKSSLAYKISEEVNVYLDTLAALDGKPEDVRCLTGTSVSNVICSIVIGKRFEYEDPLFTSFCGQFFLTVRTTAKNTACKEFSSARLVLRLLVRQEVRNLGNMEEDCEMEKAQKEGKDTTLSMEQLRVNIQQLVVAGTDTTSNTIMWFMVYLLHYPHVQNKVYQEICSVTGPDREPDIQDKVKLPYTNAVIMETQRLASILPQRATQSQPNLSHLNSGLFLSPPHLYASRTTEGTKPYPGLHNPSPICHILTVCSIPPHLPSVPYYCRTDTIIQGYTIPAQSCHILTVCSITPHLPSVPHYCRADTISRATQSQPNLSHLNCLFYPTTSPQRPPLLQDRHHHPGLHNLSNLSQSSSLVCYIPPHVQASHTTAGQTPSSRATQSSPICHILYCLFYPTTSPQRPPLLQDRHHHSGLHNPKPNLSQSSSLSVISLHMSKPSPTTAGQTPSSRATQSQPNLSHLNCLSHHSTSPQRPPLLQGRHHHPGLHNPSPICHILTVCSITPHLPSVPHYCKAETIIQGYTIPAGTTWVLPSLDSVLMDEETWEGATEIPAGEIST
ncbi:hypothetical protein RRG08_053491 [Elysia crispata]|uniref:Cytochrome P450 n=1 Tax=Elysia crispata TaxID=231223 RepID=A0AAE1DRK0_9GAST|nr:hypothetical protein RRG08_053491 [Elysia crispata]